jgi:hypothetical protein
MMGYNMYGGGGMGGMGGGQSSSMMMSSAMAASVCMSVLAAGGYYMYNNNKAGALPDEDMDAPVSTSTDAPAATTTTTTTAQIPGNLDGVRLITVGDMSMRVDGGCGNGKVTFRQSKNDRWHWNVKKIGTTSDGLPYYTLESFGKLFGSACQKRFLTAPWGCNGPPSLAAPQSGTQQAWVITGSDASGYQIEALACRQARKKSYLMQAGQKRKDPAFSLRSGTPFRVEAPPAGL